MTRAPLAARFAAKEAVSKAFGTGIGKHAGLHDLEVIHDAAGAPNSSAMARKDGR